MRRSGPTDEANALLDALAPLNEGQTLGRYELLIPVGRGGMGTVWAARLRGTRGFTRTVALKVMHPSLSADPRFESMFLLEAKLASRIRHPNICPIVDVGEERGVLFLVMEWIEGDSLSTLLEERRSALSATSEAEIVPFGMAARIVAQAARGLQAAHELRDEANRLYGVVHGDVSPHNILVTADGLVQVVDFGVATAALGSSVTTRSGYLAGKLAYLAPEHLRGESIDARADVFALGVVLYELTTGAHPFRGPTEAATLLHIVSPEPAPSPAAPGYPGALRAILSKALAKDTGDRYASMRELALELEAFASHAAVRQEDLAAFLSSALGGRRALRARRLQEAARVADARVLRRVREPAPPQASGSSDAPVALPAAPAVRGSPWARPVLVILAVAILASLASLRRAGERAHDVAAAASSQFATSSPLKSGARATPAEGTGSSEPPLSEQTTPLAARRAAAGGDVVSAVASGTGSTRPNGAPGERSPSAESPARDEGPARGMEREARAARPSVARSREPSTLVGASKDNRDGAAAPKEISPPETETPPPTRFRDPGF